MLGKYSSASHLNLYDTMIYVTLLDSCPVQNLAQHKAPMTGPIKRRELLLLGAVCALEACSPRRANHNNNSTQQPLVIAPRHIKGYRHVVKKGDTLSAISRRSGISVSTIIQVNRLPSHIIRPGDIIVLPGINSLGTDPLARQEQEVLDITRGDYQLVRRKSWTKQSVRSNHKLIGTVNRITIHHTGEHGNIARLPDLEVVKRIENYHRNERKWAAIGYHFLVGRDGKVYEGRPAKYQGAHTRGNNRNNLGISMIGDFNKHKAEPVQLAALASLIDDKRSKYGVSRSRVFGHRDLSPSICPGKHLYAWLKAYKRS